MSDYEYLLARLKGGKALVLYLDELQNTLDEVLTNLTNDLSAVVLGTAVEEVTELEVLLATYFREEIGVPTMPIKFFPQVPETHGKQLFACKVGDPSGQQYHIAVILLNEKWLWLYFWPSSSK